MEWLLKALDIQRVSLVVFLLHNFILTSLLNDHTRYSCSSIGCHLHRAQSPALEAFLTQLRCSV